MLKYGRNDLLSIESFNQYKIFMLCVYDDYKYNYEYKWDWGLKNFFHMIYKLSLSK